MRAIDGIEYEELYGSGKLAISEAGLTGTRIFKVAWDSALPFSRALFADQWQAIGGSLLLQAPRFPWILADGTTLQVSKVGISGIGKCLGDSNIEYDFAKVEVEYVPAPTDLDEGNDGTVDGTEEGIGTVSLDFSGEFLATAGNTWKFADTGYVVNEPVGLLQCTTEATIDLEKLPALPRAGIRACIGKLNASSWQGAARGTVLFLGAASKKTVTNLGNVTHSLSLKFKEKSRDWNLFLGKDGAWHTLVDSKTGNKHPYEYADFNLLLRF